MERNLTIRQYLEKYFLVFRCLISYRIFCRLLYGMADLFIIGHV